MGGKANLSFSIDELHVPFFHHLLYSLVTASEFFNVLILPILSPFLLGKETWSDMIVLSKQYKVENNLRVNSLSTNQALKLKKKKNMQALLYSKPPYKLKTVLSCRMVHIHST